MRGKKGVLGIITMTIICVLLIVLMLYWFWPYLTQGRGIIEQKINDQHHAITTIGEFDTYLITPVEIEGVSMKRIDAILYDYFQFKKTDDIEEFNNLKTEEFIDDTESKDMAYRIRIAFEDENGKEHLLYRKENGYFLYSTVISKVEIPTGDEKEKLFVYFDEMSQEQAEEE